MTPRVRLESRLAQHGLRAVAGIRVTENRSVLVSLSPRRVLSVHRAYADAPDEVVAAIVRFVARGVAREKRRQAQRTIVAWYESTWRHGDLATAGRPRQPDRPQPGDEEILSRLASQFSEYNQRHFKGALPAIPVRLSGRMRTRLGHLSLDRAGRPTEISISRRHYQHHGWNEVAHTLLHEMVHLWQCASGLPVDHGPAFRKKARETGVTPSAQRRVRSERKRTGVRAPLAAHPLSIEALTLF